MKHLSSVTLRLESEIKAYLKRRAKFRNRSMNKELSEILKKLRENDETEEAKLGGTSSSVLNSEGNHCDDAE